MADAAIMPDPPLIRSDRVAGLLRLNTWQIRTRLTDDIRVSTVELPSGVCETLAVGPDWVTRALNAPGQDGSEVLTATHAQAGAKEPGSGSEWSELANMGSPLRESGTEYAQRRTWLSTFS